MKYCVACYTSRGNTTGDYIIEKSSDLPELHTPERILNSIRLTLNPDVEYVNIWDEEGKYIGSSYLDTKNNKVITTYIDSEEYVRLNIIAIWACKLFEKNTCLPKSAASTFCESQRFYKIWHDHNPQTLEEVKECYDESCQNGYTFEDL